MPDGGPTDFAMAPRRQERVPRGPFSFLKLLAQEKISSVVVGGAALALHGIPRTTLDIDIVVPAQAQAVYKLFSLAKRAGFSSRQMDILKVAKKAGLLAGQWITFQDPAGRELVDVFLEEPKAFQRLLRRAVTRKAKGYQLNVATLDDLERMKRASGRAIDLADIALIRERRKPT